MADALKPALARALPVQGESAKVVLRLSFQKIKGMHADIQQLRVAAKDKDSAISQLEAAIADLQALDAHHRADLQEQLVQVGQRCTAFEAGMQFLQAEVEQRRLATAGETEALSGRISELEGELASATTRREDLEQQLTRAQQAAAASAQDLSDRSAVLDAAQTDLGAARAQVGGHACGWLCLPSSALSGGSRPTSPQGLPAC